MSNINIRNCIHNNWRKLVYSLCGFGLSWIDLWRGIGNGAQWAFAVNCTGFCVLPFVMLNLDWKVLDCRSYSDRSCRIFRFVFFLWLVIFDIFAYPAFLFLSPGTDYDYQIIIAIANVGLCGAVCIRVFYALLFENGNCSKERNHLSVCFFLWMWFVIFAVASVNKSLWPLWFLVMFGSAYLIPTSPKRIYEYFDGLTNGLIIGFFWIQSRAFLFRPYDCDWRYRGHYTNPNVNAMFYLFVYIAFLIKSSTFRIKKCQKSACICLIFASSLWVFVLFTGCRSVWLSICLVTVFYWGVELKKNGLSLVVGIFYRIIKMGLVAILLFFPVYGCMRYLPAIRHHPIWYQTDYNDELSVMAWDPIDSPKYYELSEILPNLLGRFSNVHNLLQLNEDTVGIISEHDLFYDFAIADVSDEETLGIVIANTTRYDENAEEYYSYYDGVAPGTDTYHPIFLHYQYESTLLRRLFTSRYYVYRYVLSNIKFWGHENVSIGVWLFNGFELYHAHNSLLQMLYWFGPVSAFFFLVGGISVLVRSYSSCLRLRWKKNEMYILYLFSALILVSYYCVGLTECIAFPGELGLTLYFLTYIPAIRKD